MLATLSPAASNLSESKSTLFYASEAKHMVSYAIQVARLAVQRHAVFCMLVVGLTFIFQGT